MLSVKSKNKHQNRFLLKSAAIIKMKIPVSARSLKSSILNLTSFQLTIAFYQARFLNLYPKISILCCGWGDQLTQLMKKEENFGSLILKI